MRRIVTLAFVVALCAPLSACGSSSPQVKAERTLDRVVATALAQKSVHMTASDSLPCSARWTSDLEAGSGTERLTTTRCNGHKGGGTAQLVLVDGVVYVRGNPAGLEYTLIYPTKAQARRYAGRWISIPKSSPVGDQMAGILTLRSMVRTASPQVHRLNLKVVRKRGTHLLVLSSEDYGILSARADGDPLPVAFGQCADCGYSWSFSKWNEPVHVHAPAHSTPMATVCAHCLEVRLGPTGATQLAPPEDHP
jgi:hypothetical protein